MSNARLSFAALFLAGALVAGCSSDDSNGSTPNGQGESDASVGNGSEGGGGEGGTLGDGGPGAGDGGPSGDAGPSPTGLDETGATIPDTNYPAPAGAIYMAPNGVDTAAGSEAAPVLTLAKAIALVPSGGTIVVRGGTYRDGAVQTSKPFTLQAYPHEKPWFDGTDLPAASAWTNDGAGHWTMPWNTPTFCGGHYYDSPYDAQTTANTGPCSHYDMVNAAYVDTQYAAVGDPQMVFVDGVYVHEVTTLAAATGANFYYDQTAKKMYVASDPALHEVEVAARPSALIFSGAGTKILGIGFKRYATNEYSNADVGAVYGGGTGALFENDVFTEMAGGALATSPSSTVSLSVFAKNGFNGMGSNGHQHSTKEADGLVIQGSIFNANNQEHFGDHCSASCAQAGVKIAHMDGFTVKNNVFENNVGHGFWCDLACSKGVMIENVSKNNARSGILYEVSDTGIIASNLVIGNAGNGIRFCAANTKVYNNTILSSAGSGAIWVYDDARTFGVDGWTDVGPDTTHVEIANNVISGTSVAIRAQGSSTTAPNTEPSQFFDVVDTDAFFRQSGPTQDIVYWIPATTPVHYTTLAAFQAAQGADKEAHGIDVSSGGDPFFGDAAGGDYTIKATSTAHASGRALPADVAAALGLTTTTVVDRGALHWPGH